MYWSNLVSRCNRMSQHSFKSHFNSLENLSLEPKCCYYNTTVFLRWVVVFLQESAPEIFTFPSLLSPSPGFTGVTTTSMSASTTTLMSTAHTTPARSLTSGPSATSSTWLTTTATAPATTQPRASNAGSATDPCHQTDRSSSRRSSSSSLLSP